MVHWYQIKITSNSGGVSCLKDYVESSWPILYLLIRKIKVNSIAVRHVNSCENNSTNIRLCIVGMYFFYNGNQISALLFASGHTVLMWHSDFWHWQDRQEIWCYWGYVVLKKYFIASICNLSYFIIFNITIYLCTTELTIFYCARYLSLVIKWCRFVTI